MWCSLMCRLKSSRNLPTTVGRPLTKDLTYRDNLLTLRDMTGVVRAAALKGYEALMHELGVDPRPVLERNDIDPGLLRDTESMISLSATARLLEDSAAATQCPDFGLRLVGREQSGDLLGPLAIAILNAPTLEQALTDASRYLFFHSPAYE